MFITMSIGAYSNDYTRWSCKPVENCFPFSTTSHSSFSLITKSSLFLVQIITMSTIYYPSPSTLDIWKSLHMFTSHRWILKRFWILSNVSSCISPTNTFLLKSKPRVTFAIDEYKNIAAFVHVNLSLIIDKVFCNLI